MEETSAFLTPDLKRRSSTKIEKKKKMLNYNQNETPPPILLVIPNKEDFEKELKDDLKVRSVRPLSECSVAQDLPRLGKKHEIINRTKVAEGVTVFPPPNITSFKSDFEAIRHLFKTIAYQFGYRSLYDSTFDLHFSAFNTTTREIKNVDLSKTANSYLIELTENQPIVKLLKVSCSQGIVVGARNPLRLSVLKDFPFKDGKQGWLVFVVFEDKHIVVIHRKHEQSIEPGFSFFWELKMVFNRDMDFKDSSIRVTELQIDEDMSPTDRQSLENILAEWKGDTLLPIRPIKMIDDLQIRVKNQCLISELKQDIIDLKMQLKQKNQMIHFLAYNTYKLQDEVQHIQFPESLNDKAYSHYSHLFSPYNDLPEPLFILSITRQVLFTNLSSRKLLPHIQQGQNITQIFPNYDHEVLNQLGHVVVVLQGTTYDWKVEYLIPGCTFYLVGRLIQRPSLPGKDEWKDLSNFW